MGLQWVVRTVLEGIPTDAEILVRKKEYGVTRSWLTRLNDVIGTDLSDVAPGIDGEMPESKKNRERDEETKRKEQDKLVGTDMGAQAIHSAFKIC